MNKLQQFCFLSSVLSVLSCGTALAQGQGNISRPTTPWMDYTEIPAPGNMEAAPGESMQTSSQGVTDMNAPALPDTQTPCLAPNSVSDTAIPSDQYNFGFPSGSPTTYKGPYPNGGGGSSIGSGASSGASLPPVGTSSVDIDMGQ